jgi:hypothetical protein
MDSFSEPYTRQGDDISIDQVRTDIRLLEAQHRANAIPLSGRVLHVCHYLPITATLNSHPGVLSPPPTPPVGPADPNPDSKSSSAWSINPRYGHAAMISGIRSLSSTHEQLIIGWTGDIISPTPGEHIPPDTISQQDRERLDDALATYQPKESDPDDERQTTYVPVWLDDRVAHGHYDGYCKQSESFCAYMTVLVNDVISPLAIIPLPSLAGCSHRICIRRLPLPLLRERKRRFCTQDLRGVSAWRPYLGARLPSPPSSQVRLYLFPFLTHA